MKQTALLLFALALTNLALAQSNSLQEGNKCFATGDYACAVEKYKEAILSSDERQKKIAGDNLSQAEKCFELRRMADVAFNSKNFIKAKEYYQSIISENPKDEYAKDQLVKCNKFLTPPVTTLSVSKENVSFSFSGGSETISVNTNAISYTISSLPAWCSVQKYTGYFDITCSSNSESTARTAYFTIAADNKTALIYISQTGDAKAIQEQKRFEEKAQKVKEAADLKAKQERDRQAREFAESEKIRTKKVEKKERRRLKSFSSLGFQSGEIAKYGLLYERGGVKAIGFNLAVRSTLIPEADILSGVETVNKTEATLGINIKISQRIYLNIAAGYGYYDFANRNDYAGTIKLEKVGYTVSSSGLMIRISRVININGGVSFMDIEKDFYNPEITFGLSFNLKRRYKQ